MRARGWLVAAAALAALAGCSPRKLAVNAVAGALAGSGTGWASDPDPQLVREALPFALKTYESVLEETPRHQRLLVATSQAFTQYAWGYLVHDAEVAEVTDLAAGLRLRRRARGLLLRGRDRGLAALDVSHPGLGDELRAGRAARLGETAAADVAALFWTGAAWGGAITVLKDDPDLLADLPVVEAVLRRVMQLDPDFDRGGAHEVMMSLEAGLAGGSLAAAKEHFERAVELSGGGKASPFVAYAETVSVRNQDRGEFRALLERALRIDPDGEPSLRLANLLAQERARWLLGRIDDLFAE